MEKNQAMSRILVVFTIMLLCLFIIGNETPTALASGFNLMAAGQTETTITLSWTKSTDVWFYKYFLWESTAGTNGPWTNIWTSDGNSDSNKYAVTGLSPNTQYWFYVEDTGLSQDYNSNVYQVSTTPKPILSITSKTTTTASLAWTDYNSYSSLIPFESYIIQMRTNGGTWATLTTVTGVNQNSYMVTGLSPARYDFKMYDNAGGYSAASDIATLRIYEPLEIEINQPSTSPLNVGQSVSLTAHVSGGSGYYNYQWNKNGLQMSIATASTYTFSPEGSGTYTIKCTVTDTEDNSLVETASISLTVVPLATQSSTQQPYTQPPNYMPTQTPNTQNNDNGNTDTDNSGNQSLAVIAGIAVVSIIAVIGVVLVITLKQKRKKTIT
jgi:hypothetical protein